MKCVICKESEYRAGLVTVVLTRTEKAFRKNAEVEIIRFVA